MQAYIIRIDVEDNTANVLGIEQPATTVHDILPNGRLVLHVKGSSYWAGHGMRGYGTAELQVYQILRVLDDHESDGYFRVTANRIATIQQRGMAILLSPVRKDKTPEYTKLVLRGLVRRL